VVNEPKTTYAEYPLATDRGVSLVLKAGGPGLSQLRVVGRLWELGALGPLPNGGDSLGVSSGLTNRYATLVDGGDSLLKVD